MLAYACGEEKARQIVAFFRHCIFEFIKEGDFPLFTLNEYKPNPNYKWHVEEYVDKDEWQRQKELTLTAEEMAQLELMDERDMASSLPSISTSKPKKSWTRFFSSK